VRKAGVSAVWGVGSEVIEVGRAWRRGRARSGGQYPLSAKRTEPSREAQDHSRIYKGGVWSAFKPRTRGSASRDSDDTHSAHSVEER